MKMAKRFICANIARFRPEISARPSGVGLATGGCAGN